MSLTAFLKIKMSIALNKPACSAFAINLLGPTRPSLGEFQALRRLSNLRQAKLVALNHRLLRLRTRFGIRRISLGTRLGRNPAAKNALNTMAALGLAILLASMAR